MNGDRLRERAGELSRQPGVYVFSEHPGSQEKVLRSDASVDAIGEDDATVLYVGKAIDLRDRVRSYCDPRSERIKQMVRRADMVSVAVTETETQALLLESNLIKRFAPRYNVRLTDDKSYPLVQFTDHPAPKIEITRDPEEGATVYGPYTDRGELETVLKAIRSIYGLRDCSDHVLANRERPCIDHEIGICSAPCTDEIDPEEYRSATERARRFFDGETGVLADPLETRMQAAAEERAFERAATIRDRLDVVESFHGAGGTAVYDSGEHRAVDVLGVATGQDQPVVARLHSEDGQLIERERHQMVTPEAGPREAATILGAFLKQYYADRTLPDAIYLPEKPADRDVLTWLEDRGLEVSVPGVGRAATLVDLAMKNAHAGGARDDGLGAIGAALGIQTPDRIEGFDVSHAGGADVVGSNVTFEAGEPDSAGYRRKRLTDVNDDYANMQDLIAWRAKRAIEGRDDRPDPDLLVIDGGEGQLNAAQEALNEHGWGPPAVAIAKGGDGDRVLTENGPLDLSTDAKSHLTRVRDEAHRFARQYHATVRDTVETPLDGIEGIGPTLRNRLLGRFGSIEGIRQASPEEIAAVNGVGAARAQRIVRAL